MKIVLSIALLICIAALAGWISYSDQGGRATIQIDKQEAREDTESTINAVEEVVEMIGERIDQPLDRDREPDYVR